MVDGGVEEAPLWGCDVRSANASVPPCCLGNSRARKNRRGVGLREGPVMAGTGARMCILGDGVCPSSQSIAVFGQSVPGT